ncbi:MAG TPA: pitrilysin family protein [Candidatus Krumholzibacteria bacterium]|nr:pitrilysin family protein [Candidatus Krumholzibacteria bacterium]
MKQARKANKIVLPGGLTILHEKNPVSKAFCVGVWTRTGARDEKPGEAGLCHFLEHMLFKGTARRSAKDLSQEIEKIGGSLDAFTTKETMAVYAQVLVNHRDVAFDLISDMLTNSRFAEDHVALERQVVIEEIGDVDDAPDDLIHELLAAEIFPAHPLGRPILGSRATVASFRRADLRRYARRLFRASNLVVAVYGNIDEGDLIDVVKERFQFPEGRLARDTTRLRRPTVVRKHVRRKLHQQHIVMGRRTFSFLDERRYPMMVLNAMMGGGMSSRLFQRIREDMGLAYNVYTYLDHSRDTGMFAAYLAVSPANASKAMRAVGLEFADARNGGLTPAELDDTKEHIKGRILLGLETSTSRMMRLARNEISYGHQVPERELIDRIDSVTLDDVRGLARELFDVDNFSVVSLGTSASMPRF